ncbi:MAG: YHYH protein [Actinomycetota bacterium]
MTPTRHLPISLIAAASLSIGLVACGTDDDASDTTTAGVVDDAAATGATAAASDPTVTSTDATPDTALETTSDDAMADDAMADDADHSHDDADHAHDDADHSHDDADDDTSASAGYLDDYTLIDDDFGTITTVTVGGDTRVIEANALPNHETGEFPNAGNPNAISEQDASYAYPLEGTWSGEPTEVRTIGVAINGVKFEPGTAETVTCASGELYRVEALQDTYDLGLDFNNAHVQPTGEYHYHGVSDLLVDGAASGEDLVHVGFAADGFLIYASVSDAYASSYQLVDDARTGTDCVASGPAGGDTVDIDGTSADGTYTNDWEYVEGSGDLDECNGIEIDGEYAYVITEEYPYVTRCLMGEVAGDGPGGGAPPDGAPEGGGAPPAGAPDGAAGPPQGGRGGPPADAAAPADG